MKYLCLVYHDEKEIASLSQSEIDQRIDLRLIDAKPARNGRRGGPRVEMNALLGTFAGAKRGTVRQRSQRLVKNGDKGRRVSL